jgi:glycosyltransferase involved in cell wall biosynthesis
MQNIVQIGKGWFPEEPGGLNRYFYDCVEYLPQTGVTVHGLVAGSDQVVNGSEGIVSAFAPSQSSLLTRWQGARRSLPSYLKAADIIVSHFALYTFPVLTQLGDRPLVVHFHGPWALESQAEGTNSISTQVKKWLEQTCYRRAAVFIVLSKAFQNILHERYGVPLDKILVVPGGVNADHFQTHLSQTEAREKLGWNRDRPTIVAVRRLAKRMGLENLVQAIAQVKQQYPDVQLKIAGKGALKETLQTQIRDLGIEDQVELLGYVPDEQLPLIYRAANFSVVPTVSLEGFGLIVVESLASGTPVLGTPIGGIPEILRPFSTDLVLDGCEVNHLSQGILDALDGTRSLPSAQECQAYIQQNFAWPIIAQKLQMIYAAAQEGKYS